MKNRISNLTLAAVTALGVAIGVINARAAGDKDMVDTAIAAGQFNILAKALNTAGLVQTVKGSGPCTVFAPTDEAFAKLPPGTLESLLKKENKDQLTAILTYPRRARQGDRSGCRQAQRSQNGQRQNDQSGHE